MNVLGIDIGGSAVKGALIDCLNGQLTTERKKIVVPEMPTTENIVSAVVEIISFFEWKGIVGVGFPAVVKKNKVCTASNIDKGWIGTNIQELFATRVQNKMAFLNDADAAGVAEYHFGEIRKVKGNVILLTVGTGIGTAMFANGQLLSNTELGHIYLKGRRAEPYISDRTRKKKELMWEEWAKRFNEYLNELEFLLSPELIILGGGVSNKTDKFLSFLNTSAKLTIARHHNNAGIIGSAYYAWQQYKN